MKIQVTPKLRVLAAFLQQFSPKSPSSVLNENFHGNVLPLLELDFAEEWMLHIKDNVFLYSYVELGPVEAHWLLLLLHLLQHCSADQGVFVVCRHGDGNEIDIVFDDELDAGAARKFGAGTTFATVEYDDCVKIIAEIGAQAFSLSEYVSELIKEGEA